MSMGIEGRNRFFVAQNTGFTGTRTVPDIHEQRQPQERTRVSFPDAILAGRAFLGDPNLVHGEVKIQSSHMPPATRGEYSLQVIREDTDVERIRKAKVLVVGCMDKRQAEELYGRVLDGRMSMEDGGQRIKYTPDEIAMITVGGGIVQTGEREEAMQTMIDFVIDQAPNLQHVVVSAHTSDPRSDESKPCGGITFLNGGKPIAETLSAEVRNDLTSRHAIPHDIFNGPELLATGEVAQRHAADILAADTDHPSMRTHVWVVVPNDETHGIRQIFKTKPNPNSRRLEALPI